MLTEHETTFISWDGTRLACRTWEPRSPSKKGLIVLHRGHEHTGRLTDLVNDLGLEDTWAFAFDARGHGHSPGERGAAESFDHMVRDLDAFVRHVSQEHGIAVDDMAVLANSVGAVIAATWVHDAAPPIRGLVMAAPAFKIKLYVPFAMPALKLWQRLRGRFFIKSYVKSKMLTHDPEQARRYDEDDLITRNIASNILLDLDETSRRIVADSQGIRVPTLVLAAGSDWVVEVDPQLEFFEGLQSPRKEFKLYPGFYHGILYEKGRVLPLARTREFLQACFQNSPDHRCLLEADRSSPTQIEYDRLRSRPSLWKSLWYGLQKFQTRTLGRLSQGVRLGLKTGFDSGETLDYVYEKTPRGWTPLGRWIDKFYLEAVGWRGIRRRREHLEIRLREALEVRPGPVSIMDIACGGGRYVLETVNSTHRKDIAVHLRDWSEGSLDTAREIARRLTLDDVTLTRADAFDRSTYPDTPTHDIAVASGLYELFSANEPVLESLKGIFGCLKEGGVLIYTGQPWHPQVEMIARTLVNRDGDPWIMRRRSQLEMDELVRAAGFRKQSTLSDSWGIFSVSVATKETS